MIEKGANDWDGGLEGACEGGNKETVEMMIEKGANNWNEGLEGACEGGNKEIVDLMIEKGADDLNGGLQEQTLHVKSSQVFPRIFRIYLEKIRHLKKIRKQYSLTSLSNLKGPSSKVLKFLKILTNDFLQVQVLQVDEKLRGIYCNPLVCSILNFLFFNTRNELPKKDYIEFRHLIYLRGSLVSCTLFLCTVS